MSATQEIKEIIRVYAGLETLYQAYFPKTEPYLIHDLLRRLKKNHRSVSDIILTYYHNYNCEYCLTTIITYDIYIDKEVKNY